MKLFFYPACKPEPDHSHPLPHMPIPSVPPPLVPTSFPWWPWPSPATSCLGHMPWPSSGNIFWVCFCLERVGHRFIRLCRRIFLSIFLYLFCHILYSSFSSLKPLFQVYKHGFCTKWKAGERDKYEQVKTHTKTIANLGIGARIANKTTPDFYMTPSSKKTLSHVWKLAPTRLLLGVTALNKRWNISESTRGCLLFKVIIGWRFGDVLLK